VACATGPPSEDLIEHAVTTTVERTHQRERHWWSSGWHGYRSMLVRAYRQRHLTGKRGRPGWVVPATVTQTVKHRDEHGRLLSLEIRAALGADVEPAGTVHVERLNGALRDRLNALTRKTHAFAKRDATFDGLVGLQLFDHHFHRAHRALRLPSGDDLHRYYQRSPAMALGLTDHLWSFHDLVTARVPITP